MWRSKQDHCGDFLSRDKLNGNAECKETQRKIGNEMKMQKIAEELKAGRSKVISMPHGKRKKGGERIRYSNV